MYMHIMYEVSRLNKNYKCGSDAVFLGLYIKILPVQELYVHNIVTNSNNNINMGKRK